MFPGRRCISDHLQVKNIEAVKNNEISSIISSHATQVFHVEAKNPNLA
jgi:hypothetical protein